MIQPQNDVRQEAHTLPHVLDVGRRTKLNIRVCKVERVGMRSGCRMAPQLRWAACCAAVSAHSDQCVHACRRACPWQVTVRVGKTTAFKGKKVATLSAFPEVVGIPKTLGICFGEHTLYFGRPSADAFAAVHHAAPDSCHTCHMGLQDGRPSRPRYTRTSARSRRLTSLRHSKSSQRSL